MPKILQVAFEGKIFSVRYWISKSDISGQISPDFYFIPILDGSNLKFAPEEFKTGCNKYWPIKWKINTAHSPRFGDFHSAVMKSLQEFISNQITKTR